MNVALIIVLPTAALVGGYFLARWSDRRRLAREAELLSLIGPSPDAVDAAIEAHWATLPAFVKGDLQ